MATISTLHTLNPNANLPYGYFDEDNIQFIQDKIVTVLSREFKQKIQIDRGSIIRIMSRVLLEKHESIPKMNQRVIMYITNEFRVYQLQLNKNMQYEGHYALSQRLYDPTTETSKFDMQSVHSNIANNLGRTQVGGTLRFYYT